MIPIDIYRPVVPPSKPLKIHRVKSVEPDVHPHEQPSSDRRKKNDRRNQPYRNRGRFEQRTQRDRRDTFHIDDEA